MVLPALASVLQSCDPQKASPAPSSHLCHCLQPGRQKDISVLLPNFMTSPKPEAQDSSTGEAETKVRKSPEGILLYPLPPPQGQGVRSPLRWQILPYPAAQSKSDHQHSAGRGAGRVEKNKCLCMSDVFIAHKLGVRDPRRRSPGTEREVGWAEAQSYPWGLEALQEFPEEA